MIMIDTITNCLDSNQQRYWLLAAAAGVIVILVLLAYRFLDRKELDDPEEDLDFYKEQSSVAIHVPSSSSSFLSLKSAMIDADTLHFLEEHRIDPKELAITNVIAKGSNCMLYVAKYHWEHVALKRLLLEKSRDQLAFTDFIESLMVSATLSHPKIVKFLGVTWTTPYDIGGIFEYLNRGNLSSFLEEYQDQAVLQWFRSELSGSVSKLSIAIDIAEALCFLHATAFVHRDLKSRNVFLTENIVAKIGDFGTSSDTLVLDAGQSQDTVSTRSHVSTIAWTAPEVLQGEECTNKSDIYSFGVILSELDTCQQPYIHDRQDILDSMLKGNQVALLITSGALRPSFLDTCPPRVMRLALRCLGANPLDRPSALQVFNELQQLVPKPTKAAIPSI